MSKTMIIEGMMCAHCTGRVQKALEAVDGVSAVEMSLEGKSAKLALSKDVDDKVLTDAVTEAGYEVVGGVNSPYIWMKTPAGMTTWGFFDYLLEHYHVVGTPGCGFGPSGEGYFRLTAFNTHENTRRCVERLSSK